MVLLSEVVALVTWLLISTGHLKSSLYDLVVRHRVEREQTN